MSTMQYVLLHQSWAVRRVSISWNRVINAGGCETDEARKLAEQMLENSPLELIEYVEWFEPDGFYRVIRSKDLDDYDWLQE